MELGDKEVPRYLRVTEEPSSVLLQFTASRRLERDLIFVVTNLVLSKETEPPRAKASHTILYHRERAYPRAGETALVWCVLIPALIGSRLSQISKYVFSILTN